MIEENQSARMTGSEPVVYRTLHRLVRVGSCPVLEVTAVYPVVGTEAAVDAACLWTEDEQQGAGRFNQTYRAAAEAFVAWALDRPAMAATEAFDAGGVGAAYRFDRRCLLCRFEAGTEAEGILCVTRTVTDGHRRAGETARYSDTVRWDLRDWTVLRKSMATAFRRRRRLTDEFSEKFPKTSCNDGENVIQ